MKPTKKLISLIRLLVKPEQQEYILEVLSFCCGKFDELDERSNLEIVAWAEKPDPYRPPEPIDNHPDAVTTRKYMENDPETIKRLGIFD